ncbi:MAG: ATP-dependent DNA helicase [Bacteroidetes bacterium]|nr:ATP-dependent DNA helicase [Bacteroidota bacterium]
MITKAAQQKAFEAVYAALNAQQKKAVDTIDGPVMVIAGPGTGKTQILGARIGKILLETDTAPENILCLTYTDAGAIAMRKRLVGFIGASAYKVNIATFHSFCNDIIQDNLSLFDKPSLDPISELEKIELLKKLIDQFDKKNPLKRYRGDVYYEMGNLSRLFSTMKKEGWTSTYLIQQIDRYVIDIPTRDEFIYRRKYKQFEAGSLKQGLVDAAIEKMEKLKAAVSAFDIYQQLMKDHSRYDFDDMINWVITAFKENKNLLVQYQEKYLYILVDEYQDTSGTQNQLVELLVNFWEQPNLFVVGDDDQSIFRFQGANVENMLHYQKQYQQDIVTIVLENNYRSTQPILDASTLLINNNQERLVNKMEGLSKNLKAALPENEAINTPPNIYCYNDPQEEMISIAEQINVLVTTGTEPKDIAVLFKENKYGEEITHFLKQKNIPLYSKRTANLFDQVLIQQIIKILDYLACEWDQPNEGANILFEILHFKWWNISPITIATLTVEANQLKYNSATNTFRKVLLDKTNVAQTNLFTEGGLVEVAKAMKVLEDLISQVANVTLLNLVEQVLQKTGIIQGVLTGIDKGYELELVSHFFDFIKDETHRHPSLDLNALVDMLKLMRREEIRLPLPITTGNEAGVNLLTTHGSKGLEFKHVFLAGTNAHYWEKKRSTATAGYTLPDTVINSLEHADDKEELRRLFYVAITRAKQFLNISYSQYKADGKEAEPSQFIIELLEGKEAAIQKMELEPTIKTTYKLLRLQTAPMPEIQQLEEDFIQSKLEKFSMNVTALNNYLKCPLHFYYNSLIRVPSGKSEATTFGSAIHEALNKLFKKMQDSATHDFPDKQTLIQDFNYYMHRHREAFTLQEFKDKMELGETVLIKYYDYYVNEWNKVVTTEYRITNVVVNEIPLKGAIDKIEFNGKQVVVVDYKTGNIDNAREKLKGPHDKNPIGGDYWRQAVFYKILLKHHPKNWDVTTAEFDFVEPNKKKEFEKIVVPITEADITTVNQQIQAVWTKIQQKDFYTGCGKADCHWCHFVKTNELAVALHEIKAESETQEE